MLRRPWHLFRRAFILLVQRKEGTCPRSPMSLDLESCRPWLCRNFLIPMCPGGKDSEGLRLKGPLKVTYLASGFLSTLSYRPDFPLLCSSKGPTARPQQAWGVLDLWEGLGGQTRPPVPRATTVSLLETPSSCLTPHWMSAPAEMPST